MSSAARSPHSTGPSAAPPPGWKGRPRGVPRWAWAAGALAIVALAIVAWAPTLDPAPARSVSVTGFSWHLDQGTIASTGRPWFGVNSTNESGVANGYPVEVRPGTTLSVWVFLLNWDSQPHPLLRASLGGPLRVVGTYPSSPVVISPGQDVTVEIQVEVESNATSPAFGQGLITFE